ncbi:MAG: S8 family serine peptidase [Candidatus Blackburnbacteria bacterium]|nr:S8 family serine peptidase [Candidatus Blackburnbacteria bacterium]
MIRVLLILGVCLTTSLSVPLPAFAQTTEKPVPANQIIVKYQEGQSPQDLSQAAAGRSQKAKQPLGGIFKIFEDLNFRLRGQQQPEQKLAFLESVKQASGVSGEEKILEPANGNTYEYEVEAGTGKNAAENFSRLPGVAYAAQDFKMPEPPSVSVNDPFYPDMWNLAKIQANRAWESTTGSRDILIGSIDTGIDYTHRDLPADIINGHDFGDNDEDSMDEYPHGTEVAGIVGALLNNNEGLTGIAPSAHILAVKVYGNDTSYSAVAEGIVYAVSQGSKIVYLEVQSYPGLPCSHTPYLQEAIDYARSKNVVVVSAAGNYDSDATMITPASCNGVIAVGASGRADERRYYSNWGSPVDIAAPGEEIITTTLNNSYTRWFNGTSAATPHVAATAALMLAVNPTLTPDRIEQIIKETGDNISTDKPIGKRLNVYRAVLTASGGSLPTPSPTPTSFPTPTPTLAVLTPTPTLTPEPSDVNRDGCTGITDYDMWERHFLTNVTPVGDRADINGDGVLDILDYNEWFRAMRSLPGEKLCQP